VQRALQDPSWQRQARRRRLSVLGVVAAVALVVVWSRPEVRLCDRFATQEQAQEYLRAHPDQIAWLDVDGDGAACA
jgi:hypothetical protein